MRNPDDEFGDRTLFADTDHEPGTIDYGIAEPIKTARGPLSKHDDEPEADLPQVSDDDDDDGEPEPVRPYADAARAYFDAGWWPIPQNPARGKAGIPSGVTGRKGKPVTSQQVDGWIRRRGGDNIAVKLPQDLVAIDVDGYDGKPGAESFAALVDAHGPLPPTWVASARKPPSGKYPYRVPAGVELREALAGDGIDIVQHHHRYVIVAPSIHATAGPVKWVNSHTGEALDGIPTPADFPELPAAWVKALTVPERKPDDKSSDEDVLPNGNTLTDIDGDAPWDWFRREHTCDDVLLAAGFTYNHSTPDGEHYKRPGKTDDGSSATVWNDNGTCTLWSPSIDAPGEATSGDRKLNPWNLHVFLNYGTDFEGAARDERRRRDGDQRTGATDNSSTTSTTTKTVALPVLPDEFYEARESLSLIRQAARARLGSPDATTGACLARIAALTPHSVKLPPVVGKPVGLTYYVTPIAPSGVGKTVGMGIAAELIPMTHNCLEVPTPTGEGAVELMFDMVDVEDGSGKTKKEKRQTRHNMVVTIGEGSQLFEVAVRQGNTTLSVIREAYTDGIVGNANASAERRRIIPGGQYVYGMVVGLQPAKAGPLLADVDAGTPQRFIWLAATDPGVPDVAPDWPEFHWTPPPRDALAERAVQTGGHVRHLIGLPDAVRAEVTVQRRARLRGDAIPDELDGHRDLVKLKTSALLAILDCRLDVELEDWQLAEVLLSTSDAVRTSVQNVLRHSEAQREQSHTRRLIGREAAAETAAADRTLASAATSAARRVHKLGRATKSDITRSIASKHRSIVTVDEVIERATADGTIVADGDGWVPGRRSP